MSGKLRVTSAFADGGSTRGYWEGIIGFEDVLTGDSRLIESGALRWPDSPIPLRSVDSDTGGHDNAVVVGRILSITRADDGTITAAGDIDLGSDEGREAYRKLAEGLRTGISMDLDEITYEMRLRREVVEKINERIEEDNENGADEPLIEGDESGDYIVVDSGAPGDWVTAITDALIRAATIVDIPAFKNARIGVSEAIVASGKPNVLDQPPRDWFRDPGLSELTPFTVTEEGRVFGHLAAWGTCHTGSLPGSCTTAPSSPSSYARFMTGAVLTDDGTMVPVGHITMSTIHPSLNLSASAAARHYDDTGSVAADVIVGEDTFGIWVAGAIRSTLSAADVRELRAAPLSGDWRSVDGSLDLIGILAVNVPGFNVPRSSGMVASGKAYSLVASGGMVAPKEQQEFLSASDLAYLKRLAVRERTLEERRKTVRTLAGRVQRARFQSVIGRM